MGSLAERLTDVVCLNLGGRRWRLIITYGVLLDCQEETGVDMLTSIEAFVQPTATVLRALLWAILRRSEDDLSVRDVGAMISAGMIGPIRSAISAAFLASMPDPPKKRPGEKSQSRPPMTWSETWASSVYDFRLSGKRWRAMTPRMFHELRKLHIERIKHEELLVGAIRSTIVNWSMNHPPKPTKPSELMVHKFAGDEDDSPLDPGEQLLREIQKLQG